MNLHERAFIQAFVQPDRQERFLGFLSDSKKRRKLLHEFDHLKSGFLVSQFRIPLRGSQSLPLKVVETLRRMGAPNKCWTMGGRFDGQEKELLEAIQDSGDGFVVSCIPGKLAYIKTEDEEYILRR